MAGERDTTIGANTPTGTDPAPGIHTAPGADTAPVRSSSTPLFQQQHPAVHESNFAGAGRFAPSPSGELHFGNLRTAVLAWAIARATGRAFYLRIEDIDSQRSRATFATRQIEDLVDLGIDVDEPIITQSARLAVYESALEYLREQDLVYPCFCSRKDISHAAEAPHLPPGAYPGTCRHLSPLEQQERFADFAAQHRKSAFRLKSDNSQVHLRDLLYGETSAFVDDLVLRRGGANEDFAYNLAVVIDDHYQGIDQVVRGVDLLDSAPRQAYLAGLLGVQVPQYVHVPLVVNGEGRRLSKRDGAVTLQQMRDSVGLAGVQRLLLDSLGFTELASLSDVPEVIDPKLLDTQSYTFTEEALAQAGRSMQAVRCPGER
ncbi:tRNA glutamyl-Q(34) synthetase GluQRS [Corynebacterium choanae]|uniref:Glutamate--tRNA ligase n=1 Tax=Corynebacterium choanae TaxID=1862358 RepID=A0A3G6JD72_9CORY|nr:tRNA glutamyl-Q(34) synthetase GluQRS [Corynebacterium choanae]AZA14610.1 Glutamate--tRNA ligase [Corynebacterium choanae]